VELKLVRFWVNIACGIKIKQVLGEYCLWN